MNLYDVASDLFIYLTTFRWRVDAGANLSLEVVQKDLLQIFHVQDVKIRQNPSLASGYHQVKYALAVFADEVILNSDWMGAVEWERDLLELRFFDTDIGGERFFELCENLEMGDPEVAAIFYNCLALGFKGRYESDADELRQLKQDLLAKCSQITVTADTQLSPRAYDITKVRKSRKLKKILKWQYLVFIIAILLGFYVVLDRFIIWHHYTSTINEVRKRADTRLNTGRLTSPSVPAEVLTRPLNELTDDQILTSANLETSDKDTGQPPVSDEKSDTAIGSTIQISTEFSKNAAEAQIKKYRAKGYAPYVVEDKRPDGKTRWLVCVGRFKVGEIDLARKAAAEFTRKEKVEVFVNNLY